MRNIAKLVYPCFQEFSLMNTNIFDHINQFQQDCNEYGNGAYSKTFLVLSQHYKQHEV